MKLSEGSSKAQAVAAFYAYEAQVPEIATQKIAGLKKYYGITERARARVILPSTKKLTCVTAPPGASGSRAASIRDATDHGGCRAGLEGALGRARRNLSARLRRLEELGAERRSFPSRVAAGECQPIRDSNPLSPAC